MDKKIQFKDNAPVFDDNYEQYEREWLDLRRRAVDFGNFLQSELDRRFNLTPHERVKLLNHLFKKFDRDVFNHFL